MLIENVKRESTFDKKMACIHYGTNLAGINDENHYFLLVYFIVRRKKPKKIIRVSRVKRADRKLGGVARVAKWAF